MECAVLLYHSPRWTRLDSTGYCTMNEIAITVAGLADRLKSESDGSMSP
jgi:hypothetical protein